MYLEANQHKSSIKDEDSLWRHWIYPVITGKKIEEITSFDVEMIKHNMSKASKSLRYIKYARDVLRQIFNFAISRELFDGTPPTKSVKLQAFDNRRTRCLSPVEVDQLLRELKQHSIISYRLAMISLCTAMRLGEITKLKWQHVDLEKRQITLMDTKNRRMNRNVFICDELLNLFLDWGKRNPDESLFKSKHIPSAFARTIKRLGWNDNIDERRIKICFHSLRHSAATYWLEQGVSLPVVSKLLGHKSVTTTMRYLHFSSSEISDATNKISGLVSGLKDSDGNVLPFQKNI